jgi:valyl-tRNA synthetase
LGNSPDPLDLIDKFGADGVRTGMLFSSPAGNDLPYDEKLVEQGRNFSNKMWNAFRLVKGWNVAAAPLSHHAVVSSSGVENLVSSSGVENTSAIQWFRSKLNAAIAEALDHYDKFRMSDALLVTYNLIWNDFCSQYLEMIKPAYVDGQSLPIEQETYDATLEFFEELMRLVHPWTPFISEEIWQNIQQRTENDSICIQEFPKGGEVDSKILADFEILFELVSWVRNTRQSKQMSPKEALPLSINTQDAGKYTHLVDLMKKMANLSEITFVSTSVKGMSLVIKGDEFGIDLGENLDVAAEIENLKKELEYTQGFKKSVEAKLANERFVANAAPDLVQRERDKLVDADAKIKAIEEALVKLG